ncbi:MAG: alpha/beta hydrolase [Pseudomonadota bacterium]|nr:alpha/beta hydrolase [Pseudomonadota bacterium]
MIERLGYGEARSVIDPSAPGHGWSDRAAVIAEQIDRGPTVLVAHGLAVPAAVAAALLTPPVALVMSNGPLRRLDPFTRALAGLCATRPGGGLLQHSLLRPQPWLGWLASSAGLRRAVVNPYVMDRDTVAALCGPLVATKEGRAAVAAYLGSLRELPDPRALRCPVLLLWGDADPLYPSEEAAFLESALTGAQHRSVPGGQHVHPEERPWEMADRLAAWLAEQGISPAAATRMS